MKRMKACFVTQRMKSEGVLNIHRSALAGSGGRPLGQPIKIAVAGLIFTVRNELCNTRAIVPVGDQVTKWVSQRRPENSHK